ncbi:MAG TPA: superoxide dismutase [Caulobacteraceae bacterium]|nr:superoxide dismutase [Caulobacteraceae bacterium]
MYKLPDLPYAYDALSPTLSDKTLHVHHDKHHAAYVKVLNELLGDQAAAGRPLEAVIRDAASSGEKTLFNNAAQAWNHAFFWECMSPDRTMPAESLAQAIETSFGDLAALGKAFVAEGAGHFGSGWVWLVADAAGKLTVRSTHDAEDLVNHEGVTPILVCDVWEHAYYLDYQNDRKSFLETWFETIPNWTFASSQLMAAQGRGQAWTYPAPDARTAAAA